MMMDPITVTPDAHLAQADETLARARDAVRAFAIHHGFLDGHLCGCGRPTCINDNPATMSLVGMLRAVSTEWHSAPDPQGEASLRAALLAFAGTFGLDACPAGDPDCAACSLATADTRTVLRTLADLWHGRAGNPVAPTGELIIATAHEYANGLAMLDVLALRLDPKIPSPYADVLKAAQEGEGTPWLAEARAMAAEAIATWLPNLSGTAEARRVLDSALSIAIDWEWTRHEAAVFERAAADAVAAVLVRGIAHPSVAERLYQPFSSLLAMSDLAAAAEVDLLTST